MRTVIDIDDEALAAAAKELGTTTKVATVNEALRFVAGRSQRLNLLDVLDQTADDLDDPEVMRHAWR
jgi:Arc/MetJ family transcription regulator